MKKFIIDIDYGLYLVSAPDFIVDRLSILQNDFIAWIYDPQNGHINNDGVCCYSETDFIDWLNEFQVRDKSEKVTVIEDIPEDWQNQFSEYRQISPTQICVTPLPQEQRDKYGRLGELLSAGVPRIYF